MLEGEEINSHFCNLENDYFSKIVEILEKNSIASENILEKVYVSCILVDALNREKSVFPHNNLDFDVLKNQMTETIEHLLSI